MEHGRRGVDAVVAGGRVHVLFLPLQLEPATGAESPSPRRGLPRTVSRTEAVDITRWGRDGFSRVLGRLVTWHHRGHGKAEDVELRDDPVQVRLIHHLSFDDRLRWQ